jgi:hypothetical protein
MGDLRPLLALVKYLDQPPLSLNIAESISSIADPTQATVLPVVLGKVLQQTGLKYVMASFPFLRISLPPDTAQMLKKKFETTVNDPTFTDSPEGVLVKEGLDYVTHATIILQSNLLTPENARLYNDKIVAVLYERMILDATHRPKQPRLVAPDDQFNYARTIPTKTAPYDYPDAREVFNKLLKRTKVNGEETHVPFSEGLSALTFGFGTLVIHSLFHSAIFNPKVNETSSYFDLAPLYGDDPNEEMLIRYTHKDEDKDYYGLGLLKPDRFVDQRMLSLPPSSAVILVLFNRNHNYIARELLKSKERKWKELPIPDIVDRVRQEDEIYRTARLINRKQFVDIVITDYVGGIMGRAKFGGGWPMTAEVADPITLGPKHGNRTVSRGDRGLVSIEFNFLYRWHATLSKDQVKWIEVVMADRLGEEDPDWDSLTPADLIRLATGNKVAPKPNYQKHNTLVKKDLVRGPDGIFNDADLATILMDTTEMEAGVFRARGSPAVMGLIDVKGIQDARRLKTCTYNEFREWLGFPKVTTFEEWNKHPEISAAASELYSGDINKLELYPGLHAEGHSDDGLGFAYDYDLIRPSAMRTGLLHDAVCVIRSDPTFTEGYTEENYTKWGLEHLKRDYNSRSYGGTVHKLLTTNLKDYYPENSVYTWFPLTVPSKMKQFIEGRGDANHGFTFERPKLPTKA